VIGHERAIGWLCERVADENVGCGRDVALTTREVCNETGRSRQCLELLSLVALVLRLRSRAHTGDRPEAVWRQGVQIGGVLVLTALATQSAAGGAAAAGKLGVSALLGASVLCALLGRRAAALGLAAAAVTMEAAWLGHGLKAGAFVSSCAVAVAALLTARQRASHWRVGVLFVATAMLAAFMAALVIGAPSAEAISVLVFAWTAPVVLLIAGWFDPRLAAAATTIVFARLAASGFGELGRALAVLQEAGQRELLLRWLAMSSGVVGAWLVTHRSIKHTERL
jgi:hypothetical protein